MKLFSFILVLTVFASLLSFGQSAGTALLSEPNFTLLYKGADTGLTADKYVAVFRHNQDNMHTLKKTYVDSSYAHLIAAAHYRADSLEGPFTLYAEGKVVLKGTYKGGKWHGERITYRQEQVIQRAFFAEGRQSGTWEEYNGSGKLVRKISFDGSGNVTADVRY